MPGGSLNVRYNLTNEVPRQAIAFGGSGDTPSMKWSDLRYVF
jgi:hypothetical protein